MFLLHFHDHNKQNASVIIRLTKTHVVNFSSLSLVALYISVYSFLVVFRFQKTYAYLAYNLDDTITTVVELEYDYGVTEYNHGTGYAQVNDIFSAPSSLRLAWFS